MSAGPTPTLLSIAMLFAATQCVAGRALAQDGPPVALARRAAARVVRACGAGEEVRAAFAGLSPPEIDALATDRDRTLRLLATWERERRVAGERLEADGVARFLRALEAELGRPAPGWWQDALRGARYHPRTSATSYDVSRARRARFTQVISWGGRTFAAPAGVPALGAIPPPAEAAPDHVDAIQVGARVVVVPFDPSAGGFPFEVTAYRAGPVERAWRATACSAGREVLSGLGELAVELDVVANELRVWSGESHGLAIDAFDLATGAVRWRFSTDLWFARQGY